VNVDVVVDVVVDLVGDGDAVDQALWNDRRPPCQPELAVAL